MKLKGISKLVLAGTALAATAATLTTATYAWYVTNTEVTATGVQGSVAGTQIDGSLFIANNKYDSENPTVDSPYAYGTAIRLNGGNALADNAQPASQVHYITTELNPQSKVKTGTAVYTLTGDTTVTENKDYYTYDSANKAYTVVASPAANPSQAGYYEEATVGTWVNAEGVALGNNEVRVLTFKMWLKSSQDATVTPEVTVDNVSNALIKQTALSTTGLPTGVNQGDSFAIDAIYALRMKVTKVCKQATYKAVASPTGNPSTSSYFEKVNGAYVPSTDTEVANGKTYYTEVAAGTAEELATYQLDKIAKDKTGANYTTANTTAADDNGLTFAGVASSDANKYYCSILDSKPAPANTAVADGTSTDTSSASDATTFAAFNLQGNVDTELIYEIWLEGSDAQCFDSCRGQAFTFDFKYNL